MSEKVANFEGPCDLRGAAEPSTRCGFNKPGQRVRERAHVTAHMVEQIPAQCGPVCRGNGRGREEGGFVLAVQEIQV